MATAILTHDYAPIKRKEYPVIGWKKYLWGLIQIPITTSKEIVIRNCSSCLKTKSEHRLSLRKANEPT